MPHPKYKHDYSIGVRWGRLVIISRSGRWAECICDCGNTVTIQSRSLGSGNTRSCGCIRQGITNPNYRHGGAVGAKSRLYSIWTGIKTRCNNGYKYYEHINICKEWLSFPPFEDWALLSGYDGNLTIDRKNNSKNYCPSNCRWVTMEKQSQNRRKLFTHNTSGYPGVSKCGSKSRPWLSYYCAIGKRFTIGRHKTAFAAHRARLKFLKENLNE